MNLSKKTRNNWILILLTSLLLISLVSFSASAKEYIVIGLDNGLAELGSFQGYFEQKQSHKISEKKDRVRDSWILLQARTSMFENENTHVQLYHPQTNSNQVRVTHRDVYVVLAQSMNYNTLMEALLKIRAAKTFGANQVSVYSPIPLKDIKLIGEYSEELELENLITIAGARSVIEGEKKRKLHSQEPRKNKVTQPLFLIAGSNYPVLRDQIATLLGMPSGVDFENLKNLKNSIQGKQIYWIAAATRPMNDYFFSTLAQLHWLEKNGAAVHLISPYLPYARSDKPEQGVGVTTQGRLVADLIEGVGTQGITVVRAHAPQSLGFFHIFSREVSGRKEINDYLKNQGVECVVSPDAGFQKDATKYAHELSAAYGNGKEVRLTVMNKERNTDGKESIVGGTGLENIKDKKVVIIDDETASGGTLGQVAQYISKYQPREILAVVTHLAGPADKALKSEYISSLVVTDTVPISMTSPKLTVISIAQEIAEDIQEVAGYFPTATATK